MRGILHTSWRALLGSSKLLAWAPTAVVAYWGGAYMARCVNTMSAPGVPIEYRYESDAGQMLVRAESYNFDLSKLDGFINKVRVYDPSGRMVASVDLVDVGLDGDVVVARLSRPVVYVRRLADGSFDIAKMLPKALDEKSTGGSTRIAIDQGTVHYSDASVRKNEVLLGLHRFQVDGAEGSYMFRGKIEGDLVADVGGSYTKDGILWTKADMENAEVAPLLPFVNAFLDENSMGEFARMGARSAS
ncbi:MAG TPA: hypothetical protein VNI20_02170, partial [Fimbriimonadaceae bacterium]|nr:hypothetical protein [Fimbriimonadaceae bacterium]